MLAVDKFGWERLGAMDLIPAGHAIGEPALLFEKIEDDVIQRQLDKLAATKAANEESPKIPANNSITLQMLRPNSNPGLQTTFPSGFRQSLSTHILPDSGSLPDIYSVRIFRAEKNTILHFTVECHISLDTGKKIRPDC